MFVFNFDIFRYILLKSLIIALLCLRFLPHISKNLFAKIHTFISNHLVLFIFITTNKIT